jgi:23S rRNA pseudouridine1911/1915/1917 synthase
VERRTIVVDPEGAGHTVQRILHDQGRFTHRDARGLIAGGCVRRNGKAVGKVDERCAEGDRIEVAFDPGRKYDAPRRVPKGVGYAVVHEDDDVLVVDKEPGVLTVPAPSDPDDSLADRLLAAAKKRGLKRPRVLPVHRIDRFTSGLVAFARNGRALAALKDQFAESRPTRIYLAFATGKVAKDRGRLAHHLEENKKSLKVVVVPKGPGAKLATCTYRVVERFPHATLVEVTLETGRRNQIRVQLAAEGHPLIGDVTYGGPTALLQRTALHAHRLGFDHPSGNGRVEAESPLPEDLTHLLGRLRKGANPKGTATLPSAGRGRLRTLR